MKMQLMAVLACGMLASGARIQAQEKMPDKMTDSKMSHSKMGDKGRMEAKGTNSKNKKPDKMGGAKEKKDTKTDETGGTKDKMGNANDRMGTKQNR